VRTAPKKDDGGSTAAAGVILDGQLAVPDDCFVTGHQMLYGLMVKKQEARRRMAAVRKARRSPLVAAEQRIRLTGYVQTEAELIPKLRSASF
jgi:hypothetical protein